MRKSVLNKATTGLAGAVAIASGSQAYGAIVNVATPATLTNTAGSTSATSVTWDVNGDSIADFTFSCRYNNGAGVIWQDNMTGATGNSVLGYGSTANAFRYGSAFSLGTSISATPPAGTAFETAVQTIMGSVYNGTPYGGFAATSAPGTGSVTAGTFSYAGFSFVAGGNTFYGWLRMSVNAGSMQFASASYNNTPGTAIAAGAQAVPEPGTLAGLALGAAALGGVAWKRRRQAA